MLKTRSLLHFFWGEAVTMAVYFLNHSYTCNVNGKTPYEAWHGKQPNVQYLRMFGCILHVRVTRRHLKKIDDRNTRTALPGYEPSSKAGKVSDPESLRVHVTRDAIFDETARCDWQEHGARRARQFHHRVHNSRCAAW